MLKEYASLASRRYTVRTLGVEGEELDMVLNYPGSQAGNTIIVLKGLLKGVL
ncbi:MAG: hypothetical protein AAGE59_01990 [Cyanobacteria bacterium P01_F01_bin.86]